MWIHSEMRTWRQEHTDIARLPQYFHGKFFFATIQKGVLIWIILEVWGTEILSWKTEVKNNLSMMKSLFELIPQTWNVFNHHKISGKNNVEKITWAKLLLKSLLELITQKFVTIKKFINSGKFAIRNVQSFELLFWKK